MRTQITKVLYTETGHRLLNYSGKCAHLHGHSYKWEVTVSSDFLDHRGFVIDYKDLKLVMQDIIDPLDHAFLFHKDDPLLRILRREVALPLDALDASNGDSGRIFLLDFNPTTENMLNWIWSLLEERLPPSAQLEKMKLWETATSFGEKVR